jgi:DUF1365 family protein
MPRVFGYVFNPLTVYFCSDSAGRTRAVVYEVNNTFGERHFYTLGVDGEGRIGQACAKAFRVSPLMDMNLRYRFSLDRPGETIGVNILASGPEGPVLTASFSGVRRELNSGAIVREVLLHPAMTLKVIVGIHWEALRTWLKLRRARRPQGATHAGVTRS